MMLAALLLMQTSVATEPDVDCEEPMTQSAMNICAYRAWQEADAELNEVWDEAVADARSKDGEDFYDDGRPGFYETLLKAQRAWITYRDGHCESEGFLARGGTMEPMLVGGCKANLTRQRTAQLRELMSWPN